MIRRRPDSRRSNSASENVRLTFSPLFRTFRRSSSAMDEALSDVVMVMVVMPFFGAVLQGESWNGLVYSWVSGSLLVSRESATAIREMTAAATRYQAGARSLPVAAIRRVAMKGAVPPKSALERLKLTAKPL